MTVQIAIIGLGQIGTSIGLALAEHKELVRRIGHDRELSTARQAEKLGALDKVEINLPSAVRNADLVLLALPVDQIRQTLTIIAPDLKEDAVVMDTAPVKEAVAGWMKELLPPNRHYVGLTPVINPAHLRQHATGADAAHADLFHDGLIAIVTPPGVASEAIRLAADLARLLGAKHIFMDALELDGLMAATHLLPQLMAAALLNATVDRPGWMEARKVAGRAYAEVGGAASLLDEPAALAEAALLTPQNSIRTIDTAISALQALRNDIQAQAKDQLAERLQNAQQGYATWQHERQAADWGPTAPITELPPAGGWLSRLFGLNRAPKPRK